MKNSLLIATSTIAMLGAGALVPATAQQQNAEGRVTLEEVVVTARKVEENLMQVPIAITAFSAKDIEQVGMKQMTDISNFTPSFHFVNQTGGGSGRNDRSTNSLTFRGLFSPSNIGTSAGGLLFVDGAPVLNASAPALSEIERVEVLKGPQSAYFGRSTFAGAINFVTREPSMTQFKGKIGAEYSSYNSTEDTISLEGPLVADRVGVRVSGRHYERGGMYTNATNTSQKFGGQRTDAVSVQFVFAPSDSFKAKSFVGFFEDNDGPPAQAALKKGDMPCSPGANAAAGSQARNSTYFCGEIPDANKLNPSIISGNYLLDPAAYNVLVANTTNKPVVFDPKFLDHGGLRRQSWQADLKMDYSFADGYQLSSLTAYHTDKVENIIDLSFRDGTSQTNNFFPVFGGFPYIRWELVTQSKSRDWSQELRISSPQNNRLRVTAGANYINLFSPGGTVYGYGALAVGGVGFFASVIENKVETPSVFGGAYYDVIDNLTLSLEARYQWDKVTQQTKFGSNGLATTGAAAQALTNTFKSFSPRVSLDYKYARDSTVYALWSRGYRPGGFNAVLYSSPASVVAQFASFGAQPAYSQEKLDNFEIGAKSSFLDGRARTKLALYYDKYSNGQISQTIPFINPDGSLNLASAIVNTGKIDLKGVEFEGDLQATNNWKISVTGALNDSKIKVFTSSDGTAVTGVANVAGNHTPIAPRWTWTVSNEYSDHLTSDYDWYGRVDYNHIGSYYVDFSNVARSKSQDLVALRIGVRNQTLSLEGFVTNLLNDSTPQSAVLGNDLFNFQANGTTTNEIRYSLPVKRQFGVRAKYNF